MHSSPCATTVARWCTYRVAHEFTIEETIGIDQVFVDFVAQLMLAMVRPPWLPADLVRAVFDGYYVFWIVDTVTLL